MNKEERNKLDEENKGTKEIKINRWKYSISVSHLCMLDGVKESIFKAKMEFWKIRLRR